MKYKKIVLTLSLLLQGLLLPAQSQSGQSTEDAINKLLNNPEFVKDLTELGTGELTSEKLETYISKYIPEYTNFKIDKNFDLNKVYFANTEGVSTDLLATKFGELLDLKPAEMQHMKNTINGSYNYVPTSGLSKGTGNLYERGKDEKVDYAVDYAVDFFQKELGDGGTKSELIDIGGGLLGALALDLNKKAAAKEAKEQERLKISSDYWVFFMGRGLGGEKYKPDQEDLYQHYQANQKTERNGFSGGVIEPKFDEGLELYSQVMTQYKQKGDRGHYLYKAYVSRAKCKMQKGSYKAAIIDYYFALKLLEDMQAGKIVNVHPEAFSEKDRLLLHVDRAYAKYRSADFSGALADCELAEKIFAEKQIKPSGKPNDYPDLILAMKGMVFYGLQNYSASFDHFSKSSFGTDLISDTDNDGITLFLDRDVAGMEGRDDATEGLPVMNFYGLPEYFPFDVVQVQALAYHTAGKTNAAIEMYESILAAETDKMRFSKADKKLFTKTGGDISSVYATLGNFYLKKGNQEKALELFNSAINFNPDQTEYYASRANCLKLLGREEEARKDLEIVKNPQQKNSGSKSASYYDSRFVQLNTAKKTDEAIDLMVEALTAYPDNLAFFYNLTTTLKSNATSEKVLYVAEALKASQPARHLGIYAIYYNKSGEVEKEEQKMIEALDKGLGIYFMNGYVLPLNTRPYYCKLMKRYAGPLNTTFTDPRLTDERNKFLMDSISDNIKEQPYYKDASASVRKVIDESNEFLYAKFTRDFEGCIKIIDNNKIYGGIPTYILDKIECLFVLQRPDEALAYARKLVKSGKVKLEDESLGAHIKFSNEGARKVINIAESPCD